MLPTGIVLNGRRYYQGSHIGYFKHVQRARPADADVPGGLQGSATSLRMATINCFYLCDMENGPTPALFVSVTKHKIKDTHGGLLIIESVGDSTFKHGFNFQHDSQVHKMIHVDSIKGKYKFVPHFDTSISSDFMCCISIWDAR